MYVDLMKLKSLRDSYMVLGPFGNFGFKLAPAKFQRLNLKWYDFKLRHDRNLCRCSAAIRNFAQRDITFLSLLSLSSLRYHYNTCPPVPNQLTKRRIMLLSGPRSLLQRNLAKHA